MTKYQSNLMTEADRIPTIVTQSPEETFDIGRELAETVSSSTVILLVGDLGSGKTTFTKGVAAGLGIDPNEVNSPTFTLLGQYDGRLPLYHLDLYRIDTPADVLDHLGLADLLDEEAVIVIEWADKLEEIDPGPSIRIHFRWIDDSTREIRLDFSDQARLPRA